MSAQVFESYVQSLDEEPAQYRQDTEKMEAWAKELSSPSDLTPSSDGTELQKCLAGIAQHAKDGTPASVRALCNHLLSELQQATPGRAWQ